MRFSPLEWGTKFFFDKILSLFLLLLLPPWFVYIAWRIRRDSPGPVFYSQERIGYRGRSFYIYKFRTMYVGAEDQGPRLSSADDCRVTRFGRVLRKYRLDELPQVWNVLKGDMSFVGPRPERKFYIDQIVKVVPSYSLLHNMRPGITSLGMVRFGYASDLDQMVKRLKYDMIYHKKRSLSLDMMILIYTVKTVITGKGI